MSETVKTNKHPWANLLGVFSFKCFKRSSVIHPSIHTAYPAQGDREARSLSQETQGTRRGTPWMGTQYWAQSHAHSHIPIDRLLMIWKWHSACNACLTWKKPQKHGENIQIPRAQGGGGI